MFNIKRSILVVALVLGLPIAFGNVTVVNQANYNGYGVFFSCDKGNHFIGPICNVGDAVVCGPGKSLYITYCQISSVSCPGEVEAYSPGKSDYNAYHRIAFPPAEKNENVVYIVKNSVEEPLDYNIPVHVEREVRPLNSHSASNK